MSVEEKLDEIKAAITNSQNNDNLQSANDISRLDKIFSPRLDALTSAINNSSKSSSFLSWVIILVTAIGTIIAAAALYQNYLNNNPLKDMTNEELKCIAEQSASPKNIDLRIAIKLCHK